MTTPDSFTRPAIEVGTAYGVPIVRFNDLSMFTRGEDLADATMAALRQFAPDSVHPREMDDAPTE